MSMMEQICKYLNYAVSLKLILTIRTPNTGTLRFSTVFFSCISMRTIFNAMLQFCEIEINEELLFDAKTFQNNYPITCCRGKNDQ